VTVADIYQNGRPDLIVAHSGSNTVSVLLINTCPSQNLNPDVLMMEPAEDWYRCDVPDLSASRENPEHLFPGRARRCARRAVAQG
jgi:hypothetical protein